MRSPVVADAPVMTSAWQARTVTPIEARNLCGFEASFMVDLLECGRSPVVTACPARLEAVAGPVARFRIQVSVGGLNVTPLWVTAMSRSTGVRRAAAVDM